MSITTLDRFKGCLIGSAVGDYLGMPVEFARSEDIRKFFGGDKPKPKESYHRGGEMKPAGYYSDDTAMTICLAESLIENGFDVKDQFKRYQKWLYEGYATPDGSKAFGIGQNTLRVLLSGDPDNLDSELKNNPKQGGNGALMRCSPIGLLHHKDEKELLEKTFRSAIITHNNEIAVWSCIVHNVFIRYSLLGYNKQSFVGRFLETYPYAPLEIQNALQTNFHGIDVIIPTSGYSLHTLIVSLYTFFTTDSYEDCITKAIFLGGDTDTQAAVAGALAGTYYGVSYIPYKWKNLLLRKSHLNNIAVMLYNKAT